MNQTIGHCKHGEFNLLDGCPKCIEDPRAGGYVARYGDECWELDAVEPDEMVRLVQEAVEAEITDLDAWEELKEQDKEERAKLEDLFEDLKDDYE